MKERREVWGIYNWTLKEWITANGKRHVFDNPRDAIAWLGKAEHASVRRFYLVKKPNPRAELTKRVIDTAREYRNVEGFYGGNDEQYEGWKKLNRALKEYDGEEITCDDL